MHNENRLQRLDYVQAPNGARLQASGLDGVFAAALSQFAVVLLTSFGKGDFELLAQIVVTVLYYALPLTIGGQTLGKKIYGLRVLPLEGDRALNIKEALMRETVGKALSYVSFCAGFLMILWRDDRRGLHDLISQTMVVQDGAVAEKQKNFFANFAKSALISSVLTFATLAYFYYSSFIADRFEAQLISQGRKVTDISGNLANGFRITGIEIPNDNDTFKVGEVNIKFSDYQKLFTEHTLTFSSITVANAEMKMSSGDGEALVIGLLAVPFIQQPKAEEEPKSETAVATDKPKRKKFELKRVVVKHLAIEQSKIIDPKKTLDISLIQFNDLVFSPQTKNTSWSKLTVQTGILNLDTQQVKFENRSIELSAPLTAKIFKLPGVKLRQPVDLVAALTVSEGAITNLQVNALQNKVTFTAQAGKDYQIWVNSLAPSDYIDGVPFDKISFYNTDASPIKLITSAPKTASFEIGSAQFVYKPSVTNPTDVNPMFSSFFSGRVEATHERADGQYTLRLPPGFLSTIFFGAGKVELTSSTNLAPEEILYRLGAKNPLSAAKNFASPPRSPATDQQPYGAK